MPIRARHGYDGELLVRASVVLKSQGHRKLVPWETKTRRHEGTRLRYFFRMERHQSANSKSAGSHPSAASTYFISGTQHFRGWPGNTASRYRVSGRALQRTHSRFPNCKYQRSTQPAQQPNENSQSTPQFTLPRLASSLSGAFLQICHNCASVEIKQM